MGVGCCGLILSDGGRDAASVVFLSVEGESACVSVDLSGVSAVVLVCCLSLGASVGVVDVVGCAAVVK